ncbi:MAG: DUF1294 domain-containing protein [Lachnospiraceae bacterium]|nr:DUF1294 domain-containing protein [Lachnospiraceae bacterium]
MITGIWSFIIVYLLVNLAVFGMYGLDKKKAISGEWRISERNLIGAAVMGAPGALFGMIVFRHKIRKPKFYIGVPVILILEIAIAVFLVSRFGVPSL